jgi:hypothetical protein
LEASALHAEIQGTEQQSEEMLHDEANSGDGYSKHNDVGRSDEYYNETFGEATNIIMTATTITITVATNRRRDRLSDWSGLNSIRSQTHESMGFVQLA